MAMKEGKNGINKALFWEARQVPFLRFVLFYASGILAARWSGPSLVLNGAVWTLVFVSLLAFFASLLVVRRSGANNTGFSSVLFYLFLFVLGWGLQWGDHPVVDPTHFSHYESDYLLGHIDDEPRPTATGMRFPLRVRYVLGKEGLREATGTLMLSLRRGEGAREILVYGDELLMPAVQRPVAPPFNPHEFDYQSYLKNQGIWHSAFLTDSLVRATGGKNGNWLKQQALELRSRWVQKMRRSIGDDENFAIASALVLGYRGVLDPDTLERFSKTGTIHVLSVSGLHVGIVFAVFSFLLRWMKGRYLDLVKALILIALVWMYALLTGFSPSVLRAATMISFGIIALNLYRQANIFNTTCASAMLLLLYNPSFLFDVGFVLSYLAVLGIVALHPLIDSWFRSPGRWWKPVTSSASISLAAQLATFPFVFYYFHFFPVYFLPANLLVLLPATLVVYLSSLVLVLPEGTLHSLVSRLLERVMNLMNDCLHFFEKLPYATIDGVWISAFENALLYALIFMLYLLIIGRKKMVAYLLIAACVFGIAKRSWKRFGSLNRQELVLHNVNRNFAISFFENGKATVYSNLSADDRPLQYSVIPGVQAKTEMAPDFISAGSSFRGSGLLIDSGLVQFGDRRIFLFDSERHFSGSIDVDILYIRNNAMKNLRSASERIRFDKLVLDGSNHDSYIRRVSADAEILGKPVYILKNNYAYVW